MGKERRSRRKGAGRSSKLFFSLTIIIVAAFLAYFFAWSAATLQPNGDALGFDAALLDQLGAASPNQTLVKAAEDALSSAGFRVKYYGATEVTVDLYKRLPSLGYRLIVLRVHSGATYEGGVYPFTSEPYDEHKYTLEQLTGSLMKASVSGEPPYNFAISPIFVTNDMRGNFRGAVIVLSTCNGLVTNSFADPLIRRGASVVIGWDGPVTLAQTDEATEVLLKALTKRSTIGEAVRAVTEKVGADPEYASNLRYYPPEAGRVTLWNSTSAIQSEGGLVFSQIVQQKMIIRPCSRQMTVRR